MNRLVAWETHGRKYIISAYKIFTKENFLWAKLKSLTSPYGDASDSCPPTLPPVEKEVFKLNRTSSGLALPCYPQASQLICEGTTSRGLYLYLRTERSNWFVFFSREWFDLNLSLGRWIWSQHAAWMRTLEERDCAGRETCKEKLEQTLVWDWNGRDPRNVAKEDAAQ